MNTPPRSTGHAGTIRWQPSLKLRDGRRGWRTTLAGYRWHCSCGAATPVDDADPRRLMIQAELLNHFAAERVARERRELDRILYGTQEVG